jgi:cytochrome c oxidase subunit 4
VSASTAARETSARGLLLTLVALLLLAGLSLALRFAHLGGWGYAVGLGIAVVKAALVGVFFMEILVEKAAVRLAFATCVVLLALLLALVLADVVTRAGPPLEDPPGTEPRVRG